MFICNGDSLRYRILYPENPKKDYVYALVVLLHGSGEQGNDNASQLLYGGDLFLKENLRRQFPALAIFPQCPVNYNWSKFPHMDGASPAFNQALNTGGHYAQLSIMSTLRVLPLLFLSDQKGRIYVVALKSYPCRGRMDNPLVWFPARANHI